jgi:tetratricopeptide (TPR) repeat protein
MVRTLGIAVLLAAFALLGSIGVQAQNADIDTCKGRGNADAKIKACSTVIKANKVKKDVLADMYTHRGFAYAQKGQLETAIKDFDEAIKLDPNQGSAYNNRCFNRAVMGQTVKALQDCNKSLALRPNHASTLDSRGYTYLRLGQYDLAIKDYTAALKLRPKFADALFGRGVCYKKKGNAKQAEADLEAARALDPKIDAKMAKIFVKP